MGRWVIPGSSVVVVVVGGGLVVVVLEDVVVAGIDVGGGEVVRVGAACRADEVHAVSRRVNQTAAADRPRNAITTTGP